MSATTKREKTSHTLYVSDLDGTLLDADSRVSERTAHILNHLICHCGMAFTVATSRSTATAAPLMRAVRGQMPYVVLAGAATWSPATEHYEDTRPIDPEVVRQVCAVCERHGVRPFVYRRHSQVIRVHHYGEMTDIEHDFVRARDNTPYKRYLLDDEHYHSHSDETLLIYAMRHGQVLEQIAGELRRTLPCTPIYYHDIFDPQLALLEVYAQGCSKAAAVRQLAERIGAERIVAFGDNINDLPLLDMADHSVAVANAVPEVLERADEVIGANTADSVARWLMQHVAAGVG